MMFYRFDHFTASKMTSQQPQKTPASEKPRHSTPDDFDEKVLAVDQMCQEIALVEHENWFVLEQARRVADQISKIRGRHEKKFGGPIASEALVNKKVDEFRRHLEIRSRAQPKSHQRPTLRVTGPLKIQVLKAMLLDFSSAGTDRITLEDIENWCSRERRSGASEILNELGIGTIRIPSTQFFQTSIHGNSIRLYPSSAYETQSPPFPARFIVKDWLRWLLKEEKRLLRGEQTPADKASARKRPSRKR
jgi:hypothetical protein